MGAEGREVVGYDLGYDGEVFYLGLALDPAYAEGFVEGCPERIGEDDPHLRTLRRIADGLDVRLSDPLRSAGFFEEDGGRTEG